MIRRMTKPEKIGLRKAEKVLDLLRNSPFLDEHLPVLGKLQTIGRTWLKDHPINCQKACEVRYDFEGARLDLVMGGNKKKGEKKTRWSLLFIGLNWKAQWGGKTISLKLHLGYQETLLMSKFLLSEKMANWENANGKLTSANLVNAVLGKATDAEKIAIVSNPYEEEILEMFTRIILSVWRAFPVRTSEDVVSVRNESAVGAEA